MNEITESEGDGEAEIRKYVQNNREFLSRVLRHGDTNARGYALALLAKARIQERAFQANGISC